MKTGPNWVDIIVITILFITCYRGFLRGLLSELLNLVAAVSATALTINYSGALTHGLQAWFSWVNPTLFVFLVFVGLLLTSIIATHYLVRFLAGLVKWERLNWVFEVIGLLMGGIRGLWWSGLILLMLASSGVGYLRASVEERSVIGPQLLPKSREGFEWASDRFPGAQYRAKTLVPPMRVEATSE